MADSQLRIKLVAKPLGSTKYHLATFDHRLNAECKIPKHVLEDVTQEDINKEIKDIEEREKLAEGDSLMDVKPALARKIQRMRYIFEEEVEQNIKGGVKSAP